MNRLATSFVLGYHGCERAVADAAVNGATELLKSDKDYYWLGPGSYFWESDPDRAMEWARWKQARGDITTPAVVGAVIDLRHCLDLAARSSIEAVRAAHIGFVREFTNLGLPVPVNGGIPGADPDDKPLRRLDCAVIRFLHQSVAEAGAPPFDSVRGLFLEGEELYPGAGFRDRNHIQLAVCNPACILGVFHPPAGR